MTLSFGHKKSIEEIQAENERLDAEISLREKQRILKQLKENGLTLKNFGGSLKAALRWIKEKKYKQ